MKPWKGDEKKSVSKIGATRCIHAQRYLPMTQKSGIVKSGGFAFKKQTVSPVATLLSIPLFSVKRFFLAWMASSPPLFVFSPFSGFSSFYGNPVNMQDMHHPRPPLISSLRVDAFGSVDDLPEIGEKFTCAPRHSDLLSPSSMASLLAEKKKRCSVGFHPGITLFHTVFTRFRPGGGLDRGPRGLLRI